MIGRGYFPLSELPATAINEVFSNLNHEADAENQAVRVLVIEFADCIWETPELKTAVACCGDDNMDTVKTFMHDSCHDSNRADLDRVLHHHAKTNHIQCVKLLLADDRARPDAFDSASLRDAAKCGHTEVVKLLLDDNREHRALPDADNSLALRAFFNSSALSEAAKYGHSAVVKLLLDDNREHRALPDAHHSVALNVAAQNGHTEVMKLLLDDNREHRALPDAYDSVALRWAVRRGHNEVVKLLLDDNREHRALPDAFDSYALRYDNSMALRWEAEMPDPEE